jgi:hypothetical protein
MDVKPGNLLKFEPVDALKPAPFGRTVSTYGLLNLETHPREGDIYTICRDGSVKLLSGEDDRTIGWELIVKDDVAYARVAQYGFEPQEVRVTHVGQLPGDMIPASSCVVGNIIQFARACTPDDQASHIGDISYAVDNGEEVASSFDADDFEIKPLDATPSCPGAPLKAARSDAEKFATIARNLNPQLAAAAAFLNDPVQTDAMARFAEGKMSYAEMRGLCG